MDALNIHSFIDKVDIRRVRKNMLLTDEDRVLLVKVKDLLEAITETLDIVEDEDAMRSIREAEEDLRAGKVRD